MNRERKFLLIFMLLLAVPAFAASAPAAPYQGGGYGGGMGRGSGRGPGAMSPDEELKRLSKDFNLTADQQSKIKPILVDRQKKMQDLMNDSGSDRQAMRQKMLQIRQDTNDRIRAQLDDTQKETFAKQQKEREDRMQNRRGGGPGGGNSGGNPPPAQN